MANKAFPTQTPTITPASDDILLVADFDNGNAASDSTIQEVVEVGMQSNSTDNLPEWVTNKYYPSSDQNKLSNIEPWAEVNQVNSVNWLQWDVSLNQDNIPDWVTFVRTNNNFTNQEKSELQTAYSHSQQITGNPHNVTKTEVWLWNVLDEEQLSKSPNDWWSFSNKLTPDANDEFLIEDNNDGNSKKRVTVTSLIAWVVANISPVLWWSIVENSWSLELDWDQLTPDDFTVYWKQFGVKGRYSQFTRVNYSWVGVLTIPWDHQLILHADLNLEDYDIQLDWALVLI